MPVRKVYLIYEDIHSIRINVRLIIRVTQHLLQVKHTHIKPPFQYLYINLFNRMQLLLNN